MTHRSAKLFTNGNSQAVRLPAEFRFAGTEVSIRKDSRTGEVILAGRPAGLDWAGFFALRDASGDETRDFLADRHDGVAQERDV
jgi:antitoxin VapB